MNAATIANTTAARCYDHRDRVTPAPVCPTCARLAVEADITIRTVDALLAAGYALAFDHDGPGCLRPEQPTTDRAAILAELAETDDDTLIAFRTVETPIAARRKPAGWVRFVYGNDGPDVICDYTTNLEPVISPINDYADTLSN